MNTYNKVYLILALIFLHAAAQSQQDEMPGAITSILEMISDTENADIDSWYDLLQELTDNPVRINERGNTDMNRLFFLSSFQIKAIEDYREKNGDILSAAELALIPGFDRELAELLLLFISFSPGASQYSNPKGIRNTLLTSLIFKPDAENKDFSENAKLLVRYKASAGNISSGFTAEKDAGEVFLEGNPPVPDFLSGYLCYTGSGFVQKVILGDYSARFGAGTNINSSFRSVLSLSSNPFQAVRNEIRPYTSATENSFFRGLAGNFRVGRTSLSLFYSTNNVDGSIDQESGYITGFNESGLHTDSISRLEKDNIRKNTFAANLMINTGAIISGISFSSTIFSSPLKPGLFEELNEEGNGNYNLSLFLSAMLKKTIISAEITGDNNNTIASVASLVFRPSDRLTLHILARSYPLKFVAFNSNGPGYSSKNNNEKGIMATFSFEAAKHLFISGGTDLLSFPGPRYRTDYPSVAIREELRIKYLPSDNLSAELITGYRYSETNLERIRGLPAKDENTTLSVRAVVKYLPAERLSLSTRLDYKNYSGNTSIGYAVCQDVHYSFKKIPADLWWRFSIFETDSWDSRIYQYENDLLYSFSIPAFSGSGTHSYIMAEFKVGKFMAIRLKAGTTLSKGINGYSHSDELKAQVKLDF